MTKEERNKRLNEILTIYTEQEVSLAELSEQFEISVPAISRFLKQNNIGVKQTKSRKPILEQAIEEIKTSSIKDVSDKYGISEEVLQLTISGYSKSEYKKKIIAMAVKEYVEANIYDKNIARISSKYGINKKTLTKYLKESNIEIISNGRKTNFNRDFFDVIDTEEKAYWLGFMYADGYISSKRHQVGLNISLKDIDHLKKFNKALNYSLGLNVSETHQFNSKEKVNTKGETLYMVSTVIDDFQLWSGLNSKGCVPNKSLILTFPSESIFSNKTLIYDFIRGYFDGDGTLGLYQHSATNKNMEESLMFVGTKHFLEGVQKYLGNGFLMQKPNCNENTYRLSYSTSKANKAAELMYKNATIYLDRKYDIYINKFAALKSSKNGRN